MKQLVDYLLGYSELFILIAAILFLMVAVQLFLAKYFSRSLCYWRNIPCLSLWAYKIAHSRLIKYPFCFIIIFSLMRLSPREYWFILKKALYFYQLKKLFSKLDDIVDNASPECIIGLGEASLGVNLNPFLIKLLAQEDLAILNKFIHKNLITERDLFAFCNLLANKIVLQARLTLHYNSNQNSQLREKIAKNNIEISGAYVALLLHFIKKDKAIINSIEQNRGLTYRALKNIYPKATQGGELIQIAHDIVDFRYDLIQQPKIGKICANSFIAKFCHSTNFKALHRTILNLPARPVGIFELPAAIRFQLSNLIQDYKLKAFKINLISALLFSLHWEYIKRMGFNSDKLNYQKRSSSILLTN